MSFQAYLDTIEKKTGKSPADLRAMAVKNGWTQGAALAPGVRPIAIVEALKAELGLGHGHAMAVVALLKGQKKEGDA
ncbi:MULTISPECIES: DUF4287 domain-containing protein [unclassified Sphingomonas]|uniref:DUF4287 domain-containing protein n=1 Tax=unclassified Sphingomonas TaxID=196159 RepID=UPI001D113291|nr:MULTISPECIES: DUF4287 domain-containing protein [unclassified Sphingomonas]MCC2981617.1 DUF4287 domain-containing protein [Sphingomonas sp. IC4-52]MCD2316655.1 DUF4287 domain-containing protein [Sphingomonas sp. IC-11]